METVGSCPACGHPEALIALGARRDHPHPWRPWVVTLTQLYLCAWCEVVVTVRPGHEPVVGAVSGQDGCVAPGIAQLGERRSAPWADLLFTRRQHGQVPPEARVA